MELGQERKNLSDDFIDLFFNFANTFTKESVQKGFLEQAKKETEKLTEEQFLELGYSQEDLFNMDL
ncbi:MAG: hypothetical protein ACRC4W_00165 [Treponemataceae bacterium]